MKTTLNGHSSYLYMMKAGHFWLVHDHSHATGTVGERSSVIDWTTVLGARIAWVLDAVQRFRGVSIEDIDTAVDGAIVACFLHAAEASGVWHGGND